MKQTLALAAEALEQGEFPIAAIVVLGNEVITQATTSEQPEKRFLGHAKLMALEEDIPGYQLPRITGGGCCGRRVSLCSGHTWRGGSRVQCGTGRSRWRGLGECLPVGPNHRHKGETPSLRSG